MNKMLHWRLSDEPVAEDEKDVDGNVDHEARKQVRCSAACVLREPLTRVQVKCTIFLGYTSNIISRCCCSYPPLHSLHTHTRPFPVV